MRFCVLVLRFEALLDTTPTDMTTWSPSLRPELISVVPSPFRPVSTVRTSSLPLTRTVTVLCPPVVEIAADGTDRTLSWLAVTTETLAVMPGFTAAGTESNEMIEL